MACQQAPSIHRKRSNHPHPERQNEKTRTITHVYSSPSPTRSPIVTLRVGPEKRLFAAHETILSVSTFFASICQSQSPSPPTRTRAHIHAPSKRIELPDEHPEVLSCVLEYLYKGDYSPRLRHNARRQAWELENGGVDSDGQSFGATIYHHAAQTVILRDTAI